jgi:hypothetical protein
MQQTIPQLPQWNRQIKCYLAVLCEQRGVSSGIHIIFFVPIARHKFIASYTGQQRATSI